MIDVEILDQIDAKLNRLKLEVGPMRIPEVLKQAIMDKVEEIAQMLEDEAVAYDDFTQEHKAAGAVTSSTPGINSGPKYSSVEEEEEIEPKMEHWV